MPRRPRWRGPFVLGAIALTTAACAQFLPRHKPAVAPIPAMQTGRPVTLDFRTGPAGRYEAAIAFDFAETRRAFPCMADASGWNVPGCETEAFPLALAMTLVREGRPVSTERYEERARGGTYSGPTFSVGVGSWELEGDTDYRLVATPVSDGAALLPLSPRLVLDLGPGERMADSVNRMLAMLAAGVLLLAAFAWAAIVAFRRKGVGP